LSTEFTDFPLEYVSGAIQLPPPRQVDLTLRGESVDLWVSVVNVGEAPRATRTRVFRRAGTLPSVQVLDSAVNLDPQDPPTEAVGPRAVWFWQTNFDFTDPHTPASFYWFSIRTTSSDLVPSIELARTVLFEDETEERSVFYRCAPSEFALFHRRVRLFPGVVVPEGGLMFRPPS
jgi:hypothetical protein